jgi:hypothetical protein
VLTNAGGRPRRLANSSALRTMGSAVVNGGCRRSRRVFLAQQGVDGSDQCALGVDASFPHCTLELRADGVN